MANYYKKVLAKIKAETKGGIVVTIEIGSPLGLLDEAVSMAFNEHGEEHVRAMFENTLERSKRFKANFDKEQKNV